MKKFVNYMMVAVIALTTSCDKVFDTNREIYIRDRFLVDKIYDYHDNLLAEYIYDSDNKLIKSIYTNRSNHPVRTDDTRTVTELIYNEGRVSKIISNTQTNTIYHEFVFETRYDYHFETTFEYDSQGKLIKENGQDLNFLYENGRVISIGNNKEPYINTIIYDNLGNIIEHIYIRPELNMLGQPIAGTTQRVVYNYEYDDKPKPNFGLDYLFIYQPLPGMGTETGYAREISQNNLTKYVNSGTTWTYTYNEYGLPKSIETKWKDIETLEPMLMKITYKQIE